MAALYRELGAPGRCLAWGLVFTIVFILGGYLTGVVPLYFGAMISAISGGVGAAAAAMVPRVD